MWTPEGEGLRGGHEKSAGYRNVVFFGEGGGISSTGQGLADPQGATTAQAHRDQEEEPAGFSTG